MAPRRKTRSMTNRHDTAAAAAEKPAKALRKKAIRNDTNVEEWVYRFLGNLAAIERDKEESKRRNATALKASPSDRSRSSKAMRLRIRSPTPYAWSPMRHPVDSDDDDMGDDVSSPMSQARTRISRALAVDGPARVLHRDPTLLQKINTYIRAGIAEGKRRAKRYVRKALSFAIETGYLLPADRDGKLLRVSPTLVAGGKPLIVDARGAPSRRTRRNSGRRRGKQRTGGRSGRVTRRGGTASRSRNSGAKARRRRATKATAAANDRPDNAASSSGRATSDLKRIRNEVPTKMNEENTTPAPASRDQQQQQHQQQQLVVDKQRAGGSRKSSGRPSSSTSSSSPSRRTHQRPIEDLAVPSMPSRAGSSESDRRPSSFARRSRDDDLVA